LHSVRILQGALAELEGLDKSVARRIVAIIANPPRRAATHFLFLTLLLCGGLNLACPSDVQALQPEDYLGIRILQPPSPHPAEDPTRCTPVGGQTCGPGPAYPAGITDAGDVFGHVETNYPHVHHFEEGIRWLRRDSYMGDNVGKPEMVRMTSSLV